MSSSLGGDKRRTQKGVHRHYTNMQRIRGESQMSVDGLLTGAELAALVSYTET